MVALCDDLQREYLDQLLAQHPEEKQFASDLELIRKRVVEVPARETAADKQLRLQAEHRVLLFVREEGERIGHGDLLPNSVKMAKFFSNIHLKYCSSRACYADAHPLSAIILLLAN